jgi:alpha-L-fucosidase
VKGAANYRSAAVLIRNLVDCVSKGGNFVLNVGPTAEGEFPAGHVAILEAMGAWTSVNGESIYGAEPAPEVSFDQADGATCYATRSRGGEAVYVHVADWPADGSALTVRLARVGKVETWQAALLDPSLGKLESTATSDKDATALRITKPANVDASVTVIKLTRSSAQGG